MDGSPNGLSNQKEQDPCSVALSLAKTCNPVCDGWPCIIQQTEGSNSPCTCNTVSYSLYDVCFRCAPSPSSLTFTDYTKYLGCLSPLSQAYPESIPTDTPIPAWAYEPLGSDGHVDLQSALQVVSRRELFLGCSCTRRTEVLSDQPDETASGSYQAKPSPTATPGSLNPPPPVSTVQATTAQTIEGPSSPRAPTLTTSTSTGTFGIPETTIGTMVSAQTPGGPSSTPPSQPFGSFKSTRSTPDRPPSLASGPSTIPTAVGTNSAIAPARAGLSPSRRAYMVRTSAGLSAGAFVGFILLIWLYRCDRRQAREAKLAKSQRRRSSPGRTYRATSARDVDRVAAAERAYGGTGAPRDTSREVRLPRLEPLRREHVV
ncbi:hypothetical protein C8Q77DRAFT_382665 [Trametes polyzona]|nr:hypothetical protein C8Q77DRAFT_382665 [Trametes polyzona]